MTDHDDVVRDSFTRQVGLFSGPDSPFVRRTTGTMTERLEPLDADYATRVDHLRNGGGLNGTTVLRPSALTPGTVFGDGQADLTMSASQPGGRTRGTFSMRPPPVICDRPFTEMSCISASSGFT